MARLHIGHASPHTGVEADAAERNYGLPCGQVARIGWYRNGDIAPRGAECKVQPSRAGASGRRNDSQRKVPEYG